MRMTSAMATTMPAAEKANFMGRKEVGKVRRRESLVRGGSAIPGGGGRGALEIEEGKQLLAALVEDDLVAQPRDDP